MAFQGKRVVITGGSSGIGLATARALVAQGAEVVIAGRSSQKLDAAKQALGRTASGFVVDVTRESDVKAFMAKIGAFDHLVTAASGVLMGPFRDLERHPRGHSLRASSGDSIIAQRPERPR